MSYITEEGGLELTYDDVLTQVGVGAYQLKVYAGIMLAEIADGGMLLIVAVVLRHLEREWDLEEGFEPLIISSLFLGFLIGSLVVG